MTKNDAVDCVQHHTDEDEFDQNELEMVFAAFYDRQPDDKDRVDGLWSLVCAALEGI